MALPVIVAPARPPPVARRSPVSSSSSVNPALALLSDDYEAPDYIDMLKTQPQHAVSEPPPASAETTPAPAAAPPPKPQQQQQQQQQPEEVKCEAPAAAPAVAEHVSPMANPEQQAAVKREPPLAKREEQAAAKPELLARPEEQVAATRESPPAKREEWVAVKHERPLVKREEPAAVQHQLPHPHPPPPLTRCAPQQAPQTAAPEPRRPETKREPPCAASAPVAAAPLPQLPTPQPLPPAAAAVVAAPAPAIVVEPPSPPTPAAESAQSAEPVEEAAECDDEAMPQRPAFVGPPVLFALQSPAPARKKQRLSSGEQQQQQQQPQAQGDEEDALEGWGPDEVSLLRELLELEGAGGWESISRMMRSQRSAPEVSRAFDRLRGTGLTAAAFPQCSSCGSALEPGASVTSAGRCTTCVPQKPRAPAAAQTPSTAAATPAAPGTAGVAVLMCMVDGCKMASKARTYRLSGDECARYCVETRLVSNMVRHFEKNHGFTRGGGPQSEDIERLVAAGRIRRVSLAEFDSDDSDDSQPQQPPPQQEQEQQQEQPEQRTSPVAALRSTMRSFGWAPRGTHYRDTPACDSSTFVPIVLGDADPATQGPVPSSVAELASAVRSRAAELLRATSRAVRTALARQRVPHAVLDRATPAAPVHVNQWVLSANPEAVDFLALLRYGCHLTWAVSDDYASDVRAGDSVVFWDARAESGAWGYGRVVVGCRDEVPESSNVAACRRTLEHSELGIPRLLVRVDSLLAHRLPSSKLRKEPPLSGKTVPVVHPMDVVPLTPLQAVSLARVTERILCSSALLTDDDEGRLAAESALCALVDRDMSLRGLHVLPRGAGGVEWLRERGLVDGRNELARPLRHLWQLRHVVAHQFCSGAEGPAIPGRRCCTECFWPGDSEMLSHCFGCGASVHTYCAGIGDGAPLMCSHCAREGPVAVRCSVCAGSGGAIVRCVTCCEPYHRECTSAYDGPSAPLICHRCAVGPASAATCEARVGACEVSLCAALMLRQWAHAALPQSPSASRALEQVREARAEVGRALAGVFGEWADEAARYHASESVAAPVPAPVRIVQKRKRPFGEEFMRKRPRADDSGASDA
eukprot:m51a1_g13807 hypothetical protein (1092) ;mRNA; r:391104-394446